MDERVVHAYDGKTVQGHGGQQGRVIAPERQPRDAGLLVSLKVPSEAMQNANLEFRKENEVMKPKYRKRKEKEREKMFTVEKRRATDKASRWRQFGLSTLQDGRSERRSEETGTESLLHLPEGLQGDPEDATWAAPSTCGEEQHLTRRGTASLAPAGRVGAIS